MKRSLWMLCLLACTSLAHAVDFALPDLEGKTHHLSDYRGKWVVLNYWATWCPPCLEETPQLVQFHDHNSNVVMLGINYEDVDEGRLKRFIDDNLIEYPILRLSTDEPPPVGELRGRLPATVVIDPAGKVRQVHIGKITRTQIENYIHPVAYAPKNR